MVRLVTVAALALLAALTACRGVPPRDPAAPIPDRCRAGAEHEDAGRIAEASRAYLAAGGACLVLAKDLWRRADDRFHLLLVDPRPDPFDELARTRALGAEARAAELVVGLAARVCCPTCPRRSAPGCATLAPPAPARAPKLERRFPGLARRLAAPRLAVLTERPSPARGPEVRHLTRASTTTGGRLEVFASRAIAPTGEVSTGALFARRFDGASWSPPVYLGFGDGLPYVLLDGGPDPLPGPDRLAIAVLHAELDPASITFPAVRLARRPSRGAFVLTGRWSALAADADGDGLADLLEDKLATDPARADTDGDGLADLADPLPLSPTPPPAEDDDRWLAVLTAIVRAEPAGDTLFVVADRPRAAHARLGRRVLVLPPGLLPRYVDKHGPTFPLEVFALVESPDGREVFADFSFGWRGGRVHAERTAAGWVAQLVFAWVT